MSEWSENESAYPKMQELADQILKENPNVDEATYEVLLVRAILKDPRLAKVFLEDIAIQLGQGERNQ